MIFINELEYILEQISKGNFTMLPDTIAINNVYKIKGFGNLDSDGYKIAYLVIPKGSGIVLHEHISYIERYKLLLGDLNVNNEFVPYNICLLGGMHNINPTNQLTVIQTCKLTNNICNINNIDDCFFQSYVDKVLTKIIK